MALTTTSLAATFAADALAFNATAATGATVGGFAKVDDEFMVITAIDGVRISVRSRGDLATYVKAHGSLAPVTFGVQSDLPDAAPGDTVFTQSLPPIVSISADGAIAVSELRRDTTILLTKATAAALTIAGPSKVQDGLQVTILSGTAAAHTVTYAAGFYGDTGSSDIATFAAKAGASMTIVARGGTWGVIALGNVTVA